MNESTPDQYQCEILFREIVLDHQRRHCRRYFQDRGNSNQKIMK